jgi:CRP-like cAMP-binding protein
MSAKRRSTAQRNRPPPGISNRPPPAAVQNLLLAALPSDDFTRLAPTLDIIPLKLKELLSGPADPIDYVYFPGGGFCSIVSVLEDGTMVEVTTIGREGMVGISAIFAGKQPPPSACMVQAETNTCYRMSAADFLREMDRNGAFSRLMLNYAQAFVGVIMQATACNVIHSVEQRLARWLLLAHDRVEMPEFPLTQEFVAMMLGASRPTVTVVAGTLQKAGLIRYHHGNVTIVDREKLEMASCECYRATTDLLRAVMDGSPRSGSR